MLCLLPTTQKVEPKAVHLGVAEGPDDGVNDQLELRRRHREQRLEAVPRDGVQQAEELQPVLRVVLRIVHSWRSAGQLLDPVHNAL